MTSKTADKELIYAWRQARDLCQEVDLEGADAEIPISLLTKLHLDPKSISRIEPPPGFEDRLVASLMAKAAPLGAVITETAREAEESEATASEVAWFRVISKLIPITAFSLVMVVGYGLYSYVQKGSVESSEAATGDLWAKAVHNASEVEVSRWLASVSDSGAPSWSATSDVAILSAEMNERQLERALKEGGGS